MVGRIFELKILEYFWYSIRLGLNLNQVEKTKRIILTVDGRVVAFSIYILPCRALFNTWLCRIFSIKNITPGATNQVQNVLPWNKHRVPVRMYIR